MVKPQHGGSALGATPVRTAEELPSALVGAFAYGEIAVVEEFVDGVELAITVVEEGDDIVALPAVEIAPVSGVLRLRVQIHRRPDDLFHPGPAHRRGGAAAAELAVGAHLALGLRDISRTDAIATRGRSGAFPGGQRVARAHRDLDAADVGGRVRSGPRRGLRGSWSSGPSPAAALTDDRYGADRPAATKKRVWRSTPDPLLIFPGGSVSIRHALQRCCTATILESDVGTFAGNRHRDISTWGARVPASDSQL